jgi:ribosomal protein S18 acetylase RimI-like enzyme
MEYRILNRAEISKFQEIVRTEVVDHRYYIREGRLTLEAERWDFRDWSVQEKQRRTAACLKAYDDGDTIFGAFDGLILVGVSVFEPNPLPSAVGRFNFGGIWVSQKYRGKGVGKKLALFVINKARKHGAKSVYTSATPSENTVRFYMSLGFRLTHVVDPDMYEKEPEDIHMELMLLPRGRAVA